MKLKTKSQRLISLGGFFCFFFVASANGGPMPPPKLSVPPESLTGQKGFVWVPQLRIREHPNTRESTEIVGGLMYGDYVHIDSVTEKTRTPWAQIRHVTADWQKGWIPVPYLCLFSDPNHFEHANKRAKIAVGRMLQSFPNARRLISRSSEHRGVLDEPPQKLDYFLAMAAVVDTSPQNALELLCSVFTMNPSKKQMNKLISVANILHESLVTPQDVLRKLGCRGNPGGTARNNTSKHKNVLSPQELFLTYRELWRLF